jgi:hypothetical protein
MTYFRHLNDSTVGASKHAGVAAAFDKACSSDDQKEGHRNDGLFRKLITNVYRLVTSTPSYGSFAIARSAGMFSRRPHVQARHLPTVVPPTTVTSCACRRSFGDPCTLFGEICSPAIGAALRTSANGFSAQRVGAIASHKQVLVAEPARKRANRITPCRVRRTGCRE